MKDRYTSQPTRIYANTLDLSDPDYDSETIDFHFVYHSTVLNVPVYICDKFLSFSNDLISFRRRNSHKKFQGQGMTVNLLHNPYYRKVFESDYFICIYSDLLDKPDAMNFVLLHELGHFTLKHTEGEGNKNIGPMGSLLKELEADIFAIMMGADAEYIISLHGESEALRWYNDILRVFRSNYLGEITVEEIWLFVWQTRKSLSYLNYDKRRIPRLYEHLSKKSIR